MKKRVLMLGFVFLMSFILIGIVSVNSAIIAGNQNSSSHTCGNSVCENTNCTGDGCYLETEDSCPQDCNNSIEIQKQCGNGSCTENNDSKKENNETLVGNDSDEHGCKGSAGYSWCGEKQKCLRVWEENCTKVDNNYQKCQNDSDCKLIYNSCDCEAVSKTDNRTSLTDMKNGSSVNCGVNDCMQNNITAVCINNRCKKSDETLPGEGKVKILPETASLRARERLGELGFNVSLKEVGTGNGNETKPYYEVSGEKEGKMFGLFKVKGKVSVDVDAETGEVMKVHKPWWAFLASGI